MKIAFRKCPNESLNRHKYQTKRKPWVNKLHGQFSVSLVQTAEDLRKYMKYWYEHRMKSYKEKHSAVFT